MSGSVASRRGSLPRRGVSVLLCSIAALVLVAPSWAALTVTRVEVRPEAHQTVVALITAEQKPLEITCFSLAGPPRLVFDLPGAQLSPDLPSAIPLEVEGLKGIRLGQFTLEPDVARVVVDVCEEAGQPTWTAAEGEEAGETLIVLREPGVPVLGRPTVARKEGAVLVRLAGVGALKRDVGVLDDPPRVFADVTGAVVEEQFEEDREERPLRRIRMAQQPSEAGKPVVRVVLELAEGQAHSVFSEGEDLVVAVGPTSWALPLPEYVGAGCLKGKRIVVDPGHGGDDIGAPAVFGRTPGGPYEKDVVLDIGRRLARVLEAEGASVTMTRSNDTYISLQGRAALANRLKADALISIHCNSCDKPNTLKGTSVYYDHQHSVGLARLVQDELIAALGTTDKGVRNANFAVIRRTTGPGVLVETAYINHESDRERLVHPNFRERTARAIARGLAQFVAGESAEGAGGA
jgi:N-acetylmuramoyl-L-alanine amidase